MTSLARLAAGLSAGLIFSRLLGLARDMLAAWLLGTGPLADALSVATRLPHVMRRLLGEGALSMTMTADLIRAEREKSAEHAFFPLTIFFLVLLGEAAAPALVKILAPGLEQEVAAQAAFLLRICLPYVVLASMAAMDMAAMHALGSFTAPSLSPALFNIVFIASTLGALCLRPGAGQEYMAIALALAMLLGGAAQVVLQRLALRGFGIARQSVYDNDNEVLPDAPVHIPAWGRVCRSKPWAILKSAFGIWKSSLRRGFFPHGRNFLRLAAGIFGAAGLQLAMLCAMLGASWLPGGSVAALNYAERLVELPIAITGAAIGMAGLPLMAGLAAAGRHEDLADSIKLSLRLAMFIALPAMAGLMAVSGDLVRALLGHGAFNEESAVLTATALCAYAPGLPGHALARPLIVACNAQNDMRGPALSGILLILCTIVGGFAFTMLLPPDLALAGPPLGVSLGLWAQAFMLWLIVRGRLAGLGRRLTMPDMRVTAAGALVTALAALAGGWLAPGRVSGLALSVSCGIAVYGAFIFVCGGAERDILRDLLKKKLRT